MIIMKKLFTFLLIMTFSALTFAQVIVSTDPENKNVVLEEFTGIHCGFCPQGHIIAQGIQNSHPDDVVLVNIHEGAFSVPSGSEPDYRTMWGSAIAGLAGSSSVGWPSGSVNRHLFSGSNTAMSRSLWSSSANQILAQPSYLNVGLEATIVRSTRQLIVEVEVYYTDNSTESTNLLNVVILQDSIAGPQTSGGAGNNYNHMHMLRHLLTGQWGTEITETTTGSLHSQTFTYELPEDYNGVDVVLEHLDIVAYVTETHQEVVSGNSAGDINIIESNDYDAAITAVAIPQTACSEEIIPEVNLKNYGEVNLTSLEFKYSINDGDELTYSWTGNLAQNETDMVTLPSIIFTPTDNNIVNINCEMPNGVQDQLPQNDSYIQNVVGSQNFPEDCNVMILITSDPENITWSITGESGNVIVEGGPYSSNGFKLVPFTFPETGCYVFTLVDEGGNNFSASGGRYMIADGANQILWEGAEFTNATSSELARGITVDIDEVLNSDDISISPNPVTNYANIEFNLSGRTNVNIAIFDILGKNVSNLYNGEMGDGAHNIPMNVSELNKGVYFVKIQMNNEVITKKIMVTK